jgi:hypothetical protein
MEPSGIAYLDLQAVFDQVASVEGFRAFCVGSVPTLSPVIDASVGRWMKRNASLLSELDAIWVAHLKKNPGTTDEDVGVMRRTRNDMAKSASQAVHTSLATTSGLAPSEACVRFRDSIDDPRGDLSVAFAEHIALLRHSVP